MNFSANALNNDLLKIINWAYQCEMSFNHDPSKQAQEVIFSHKIKKPSHPVLIFNNSQVIQTSYQRHLDFFLDEKLNLDEHLRYIANKVNTSIGLLRELQKCLPRRSKSFIRPHPDYVESNNNLFSACRASAMPFDHEDIYLQLERLTIF